MQTTITPQDGAITIRGPYSESNNRTWRELGGKFSGGAWQLPDNETTRNKVAELFGTKSEVIEILVPADKATGTDILQIGGYVLAQRRGRDSRVEMPPGVSLAFGRFPASGGSVKNPRVAADATTLFRLHCRQSFAEANGLAAYFEPTVTVEI